MIAKSLPSIIPRGKCLHRLGGREEKDHTRAQAADQTLFRSFQHDTADMTSADTPRLRRPIFVHHTSSASRYQYATQHLERRHCGGRSAPLTTPYHGPVRRRQCPVIVSCTEGTADLLLSIYGHTLPSVLASRPPQILPELWQSPPARRGPHQYSDKYHEHNHVHIS